MRCRFSLVVLFFSLAFVPVHPPAAAQLQAGAPAAANGAAPAAAESKVALDAPVITLPELCGNVPLPGGTLDSTASQTAAGASHASAVLTTPNPKCKTIITRQQFEDVVKEASANGDPQLARTFAYEFAETLRFARKAVEIGLDKDPAWQALLQYKYQQALYSVYKTSVKRKASEMSDADVEKFYNANRDRFELFGMWRIHVPNVKEHHPAPGSVQPKIDVAAEEAAMKDLAIKIRAEAVAGGNFEKLQAKAYKIAGVTDDPPPTDMGDKWSRDTIPADARSAVLALKVGEITEPIHNDSGWHIIKLVSRTMIPLSEARQTTLQLVVGDEANAIRDAVKPQLNDQYFVSAPTAESAP